MAGYDPEPSVAVCETTGGSSAFPVIRSDQYLSFIDDHFFRLTELLMPLSDIQLKSFDRVLVNQSR
jgi:hypothetical protein